MVALQWADVWQTQEAAKHQPPLWRLAPRVGQEITVAFFVDLPTREARELKSLRADLLYYFRLGLTECENHIHEQIRGYILQQERIDEASRQPAPISFRQERRKWERRVGYFILAGIAVVVFALNEHFHNKSGQVVLIVLGGGALAFPGALIYVHGFLWVTEKLGYRAGLRSFKLTMASTGTVFFALWAAWAYAVLSGQ